MCLRRISDEVKARIMQEEKGDIALSIFIWAAGIYVSANLAALGFLSMQVLTLNSKMTQLEASRVTTADIEKLRDSVTQLALRVARMPEESPPKWYVDRLEKIERAK